MKLTYNNGETTVTVEGKFVDVIDWYIIFVHSQTACEAVPDIAVIDLINRKTSDDEAVKVVTNNIGNPVNDPRAGEPDEDGWMTWTPTDSEDMPNGLKQGDKVDYTSPLSKGDAIFACNLKWSDFFNAITKFRLSK